MREVKAGRVWVNTTLDNGPETPLGGMKQSGLGREGGVHGLIDLRAGVEEGERLFGYLPMSTELVAFLLS